MRAVVHLLFMPSRFYCHACKSILIKSDAIEMKLLDRSGSRYYCPTCNSLLLKVCKDCEKGIMRIPKFPTSGDYDIEGWIEKFCTECGHGFLQYLPWEQNGNGFSKRKVRKLVDQIFTRQHLPYMDKKALLTELFAECHSKTSTIEFLAKRYGEDKTYLQQNL